MKQTRFAPRQHLLALAILLASAALRQTASADTTACDGPAAMGIARTIEIDGAEGGLYGSMSPRANHPGLLRKKEIALTFDDGPLPWITKSILDTLDKACVKGTFFSVGRMALAYPATVRDVLARGHTLGTHTFSHPFNMPRMNKDKAQAEIEQGFAAVATAAGAPIAPFFRFTGLNDSAALIDYLHTRSFAAFTVDVVSNDSYISDVATLTKRTIAEVEARQGGIILFHDIKTTTAKALPGILAELKAKGYSVVHFVPKAPAEPRLDLMASYAPKVAKLSAEADGKKLLPFYGAVGPEPAKGQHTQTENAKTQDAKAGTRSDPQSKTSAATVARPEVFKGGLDLAHKLREAHPGVTAFASGYPEIAAPAQAAATPSKGALWDVMETWSTGVTAAPAPSKRKR